MKRALIVGGGVAGSVAAMALTRAGIQAVICEAMPQFQDGDDLALTLATNGLDALAAVELDQLVIAGSAAARRTHLLDHAGRSIGTIAIGSGRDDGAGSRVLGRSRLRRLLLEEAKRRGIQVELGKRLVDARSDRQGVVAHFADETEAEADFIVGADGRSSALRRQIDPAAGEPRYAGWLTFAGETDGVVEDADPESWHLILARRALFAFVSDDGVGTRWQVQVPHRRVSDEERSAADAGAWRDWLLDRFDKREGPARELIAEGRLTTAAEEAFELAPVRHWHRARIVLVGDAAHASAPSSGQGASMACEDAVTLARCVRDIDDLDLAFRAYQRLRHQRALKVVREGRRGSLRRMPGAIGRRVRNVLLRAGLRWLVNERSLAWLYDHHVDWEAPVAAPRPSVRVRRRRGQ